MSIVYSDVFSDTVSKGMGHWELKCHATESLLQPDLDVPNDMADSYILRQDEWGQGGHEFLGMKAQFWTPKYPLRNGKNVIVFRGTALSPTYHNLKKRIGRGFYMDFEQGGIGKESFELFYPKFGEWIQLSKFQNRGLVITGHSLGLLP
jgi:hypothetical protein